MQIFSSTLKGDVKIGINVFEDKSLPWFSDGYSEKMKLCFSNAKYDIGYLSVY